MPSNQFLEPKEYSVKLKGIFGNIIIVVVILFVAIFVVVVVVVIIIIITIIITLIVIALYYCIYNINVCALYIPVLQKKSSTA